MIELAAVIVWKAFIAFSATLIVGGTVFALGAFITQGAWKK